MSIVHSVKPISQLVDERIRAWEVVPAHEKEQRRRPVVAVSRETGSLGEAVARALADELGMDLYDDRIISEIAGSTHMSESVVRTLDEKGANFVNDLFAEMIGQYGLTSDEYFNSLVRSIATIAWHGNGVIVGRGAAYVIQGPRDLKVRFIAPLDTRIENTMREFGIAREAARHRVLQTDADHRHFTHRYFRMDFDELRPFDLVINNKKMDVQASVQVIKAALRELAVRD